MIGRIEQTQSRLKLFTFVLISFWYLVWINFNDVSPIYPRPPIRNIHANYNYQDYENSVIPNWRGHRILRILLLSAKTYEKTMVNLSIDDKCIIMFHQKHLYNISDVVIFKEGSLSESFLGYRPPGQRWMFHGWEAAYHKPSKKMTNIFDNVFNYTMTYSVTSDVYLPYGKCEEVESNPENVNKQIANIVKHKTKLVAWFVTHCQTNSMRENYVRQLMEYIQVDVYGGCGNNSCPRQSTCRMEDFLRKYKFYLAFENTLNGEYITEKLWRSLSIGIVPIVYGALETYSTVLPSGSYIDVEDFSSPQELGRYISKVSSNQTLYQSFFSWKYKYSCRRTGKKAEMPALCDFLISTADKMSIKSKVWEYPSTRTENASLYLQRLGVSDITRQTFNLTHTSPQRTY